MMFVKIVMHKFVFMNEYIRYNVGEYLINQLILE